MQVSKYSSNGMLFFCAICNHATLLCDNNKFEIKCNLKTNQHVFIFLLFDQCRQRKVYLIFDLIMPRGRGIVGYFFITIPGGPIKTR